MNKCRYILIVCAFTKIEKQLIEDHLLLIFCEHNYNISNINLNIVVSTKLYFPRQGF